MKRSTKACLGRGLFLLLAIGTLWACRQETDHGGLHPLAEVNGRFLYREDLRAALPLNLTTSDSTRFADTYIRNWIEDELLYQKAERNIPDNERIEKMVGEYRRSLILHEYQQQYVAQRLSGEIPEEEMQNFYENNKSLFVLQEPAIKGLFIKVPLSAYGLNDVKKWYKENDEATLEQLEKYCFQNAVIYEYFYDHWVPVSELDGKIKISLADLEENLAEHRYIETQDEEFCYLLNINEFLMKGKVKPYDLARPEILDVLINYRKVEFLKKMKEDLYSRASEMGRIKLY